jgi:O-acetyl-ADP-ribose deacetylase (regulator of RNase III)
MGRIVLLEGDISEQEVDAIVNAANTELVLGAGVAGAIRSRGGPTIQQECDAIGSIGLGEAVATGAGDLAARLVIHAAGMPPGGSATESSVHAAIRRSLEIAREQGCETIAIPALGAGIGGFPAQRCAEILLDECRAHLAGETTLREIRIVLFGEPSYRLFEATNDATKVREQMEKLRNRE